MSAAAEQLVASGRRTACLKVFEQNIGARRFYETLGARKINSGLEEFGGRNIPYLLLAWNDMTPLAR